LIDMGPIPVAMRS